MANVQIVDLPANGTLGGDELLIERDAIGDKKVTLDALTSFVKSELTPTEILNLVKAAAPESNGLDANLLQGLAASFFQNASNLISGTVDDNRLPLGEFNTSWSSGGAYPDAGNLRGYWKIPEFVTGIGNRIMIQFGYTNFIYAGNKITTTYLTPFASGWGTDNSPVPIITPQCRSNEWPTVTAGGGNVEMDIRLYGDATTSTFTVANIRTDGSGLDTVRANWIAIGKY